MSKIHLNIEVRKSGVVVGMSNNEKTGPIPVSTSSVSTCPSTCPLKDAGCYAKGGPLGMHWKKVSAGTQANLHTVAEFASILQTLPEGQLWRMNQAGDLPGEDLRIDAAALQMIVNGNKGRRGFAYTHKPMVDGEATTAILEANRDAVKSANAADFTVNLSANNASHADALADLHIGPVALVVPIDAARVTFTPAGRKVVVCPAQQRDDVTCATCGLCAVQGRAIVGFRAHGVSAKKAEKVANG